MATSPPNGRGRDQRGREEAPQVLLASAGTVRILQVGRGLSWEPNHSALRSYGHSAKRTAWSLLQWEKVRKQVFVSGYL